MKKVQLGNSSLHISQLSLGCMSLPPSVELARPIIEAAIEAGINYFDTADLYDKGVNEQIVGKLLLPYRDDIYIATKVGNRWTDDKEGWHWDASPAYIKEAVKNSLRRLNVDIIDLYQLHGGTKEDDLQAVIETFEELKRDGYIREYGISSIRPNVFVPFLRNSAAASNMMQFNLLDRAAEEWFGMIADAGASVVTRGTVAKGILTADWQTRSKDYMSYNEAEVRNTLQQLEAHYGSLHALAFAFNLHFDAVASTVIGASSKQQLLENVQAYKDAQAIQNLDVAKQLLKQTHYTAHRYE